MHYRFTASKEAIELNLINLIKENGPFIIIKKENDSKGISFSFTWERLSDNRFKLNCYHKGIFSILGEEFKEILEKNPLSVINTIFYKELFSVEYIQDPAKESKDTVSTENIKFKFIELFEDETVMISYLRQIFNKVKWTIEFENESGNWENYTI